MAKNIYIGIANKAHQIAKGFIGIDNKARRIKKIYIGVNNIAKLCYNALVTISYVTSLTANYTSKEMWLYDKYSLPTLTPTNSNRVDFWFDPSATAKNDSKKKYIDYPWCAYADANSSVYSSYGYAQDLLAKHWDTTGASKNLSLGTVTTNTICEKKEDHTLQHTYCARKIKVVIAAKSEAALTDLPFAEAFDSKGVSQKTFMGTDDEKNTTYYVYPGMKMKLYAKWDKGFGSVGSDGSACSVTIDGVKVLAGIGTYTYTIPNNVSQLTLNLSNDLHTDFSSSYRVTMSTTKI